MMDRTRYMKLASKWLRGTITEGEKEEFSSWYHANGEEDLPIPDTFAKSEEQLRDRILEKVRIGMGEQDKVLRRKVRRRWMLGVAASLLIGVFGVVYFFDINTTTLPPEVEYAQEVRPGGNKATLILDNGTVISLSEEKPSLVVGDQLAYGDGSLLVGDGDTQIDLATLSYATLSVPKGGQYQLVLHDGTKVWLNSGTSLRYPSRFGAQGREVELLEGEAYFEVVAEKDRPFFVQTADQRIEVLGTQFNVSAYADEDGIKTTLVEGSVAIYVPSQQGHSERVELIPNQQAYVTTQGVDVFPVDLEGVVAWKNGYFHFNEADIFDVMKQLARWYDIEVRYDLNTSDDMFVGKIPRAAQLDEVLGVLETAGVHFKWTSTRQLTVLSK